MKQIEIKNLTKEFFSFRRGRITAVKNIDFRIEAGELFVLLGPSGCGKSTLLNIIAGIEKPTEGEITIGETTAVSTAKKEFRSPRERDVAMVFQSYALYPHLSVYDNIAFPLKIARTDKDEIKRRVGEVARMLEIENLLDARPKELSGGQRQRVALGRAIIRRPNLLLLDEPLSNLDALLRISMRSELKQLQRRIGVTTIYVTHDQTEAMSLGDRVAVLREGTVQQIGWPGEIYRDPVNMFVARFVGSPPMNFLKGRTAASIMQRLDLHPEKQAESIALGIRPEHIDIVGESDGLVKGRLNMIGALGGENILYVDIEGREVLVRIIEDFELKEGQPIGLAFSRENIFLFDRASGGRLKKRT